MQCASSCLVCSRLKAQEEGDGRGGIQHWCAGGHRAWTTTSLSSKLGQEQLPVIFKSVVRRDTVIMLIGW